MYNIMYNTPSFYSHVLNGLLLLFAIILLIIYFKKIKTLNSYRLIKMFLLFSLGFGVHSLTHLGMEKGYGYNPLIK
jgi:hypothetical protein